MSHSSKYLCKYCNKEYSTSQSRSNHYKIYHTEKVSESSVEEINEPKYKCKTCNIIFKSKTTIWRHKKICLTEIEELKKKYEELKNSFKILQESIKIHPNTLEKINTQLNDNNTINLMEPIKSEESTSLILNNVTIFSRNNDNYINATQLCQAGNKQFNDWFRLNTTKQLINEAMSETGIPVSQLIDIKKGNSNEFNQGSWIHPDLAIQLAQWISPKFSLQVSKWIRTLLTNGNVSINVKLTEAHKEINLKDYKIQLLKDSFIKKQRRKNYPDKNVIYMITTDDNKKKRIYIIGKTINLKKRLSNYNKTAEHQVVYYKSCNNEDDMNIIEIMILNKLKEYKEKANRDRFILPIEKDITFFINIIDSCINFIMKTNNKKEII